MLDFRNQQRSGYAEDHLTLSVNKMIYKSRPDDELTIAKLHTKQKVKIQHERTLAAL